MTRRGGAATAATTEAADLFLALGAVVKRLRHHPLPEDSGLAQRWPDGTAPAPRHVAALLHIAVEGPIGMTELAERLEVSLATVSLLVTELADWDIVERSSDESDRRRTLVSVPDEHRAMLRAIVDQRLAPLQRTLARLEPAQRAGFAEGLKILAHELDRTKESCR